MRQTMIVAGAMLAALAVTAGATTAMAENNDESSEMKLVEAATVTAAEAAKAVADQESGKVSSVQIVDLNGTAVYHVEVVASGQQKDFAVDAKSGAVSPMAANESDGDEGGDQGGDQD